MESKERKNDLQYLSAIIIPGTLWDYMCCEGRWRSKKTLI